MDDIEVTDVLLPVDNHPSTAHVTATSDHDNVSGVELNKIRNFVLHNVELDGVIDLDERVWVPDGPSIMCNDVWDTFRADRNLLDLAKLVGCLLRLDAVDGKATLNVVKEAEMFTRLFDGENVY